MTEANRFYPGGVLLINSHSYSNKAVLRHHDVEDSNPSNQVYINGVEQGDRLVGKYTSVTKDDAVLAWEPMGNRPWNVPVGPAYIQYGLVVLPSQSCGRILVDDEDKNNKNWVKLYENGVYTDLLNEAGRDHYGILVGENTEYCIGLSTEGSFVY